MVSRVRAGRLTRFWRGAVTEVRERVDSEAAEIAADPQRRREADRQMVIVFLTTIACLILVRFAGTSAKSGWVTSVLHGLGWDDLATGFRQAMTESAHQRYYGKAFWAVGRLIGYVVVPLIVVRFALRQHLSLGTRTRGTGMYWKLYAILYALLVPAVFAASFGASFQAKYPFYAPSPGESLWPYFLTWELLYAMQFVALEFFFRGFMLHGLRPRLGYASLYAMMVPYTMIHFTKPLPEAIGSVAAGFVLGTLSLKSGSIWWGAAIHIAVAFTMDGLALWHRGLL